MARLTRKELKKDPFLSVYYDDFVEFAHKHYQNIIVAVLAAIVAILAVMAWGRHQRAQEVSANALLGTALSTFNAYVGPAAADELGPGAQSFTSARAKYQAALKQFSAVVARYPRQKAAEIALYHIGICQAQLGQETAAIKTLRQASRTSDANATSLARFALAEALSRNGQLSAAQKIYTQLAAHPTRAVPAATAWLGLANADRTTQPAEARRIYERLVRDYGSNTYLAEAVEQQLSTLAK